MKGFLAILLIFTTISLKAQDTIRIMHYNLLNYGNNYGGCNNNNNNPDDKDGYLKIITGYLHPDILTVNEISSTATYHDQILFNVLNVDGNVNFKKANLPNLSNSPIMNQVFYNSQKLTLLWNEAVETGYRDIDVLRFHVVSGAEDSIRLNLAVAHLKAGSEPEDAQERAVETLTLMTYLNDHDLNGNFLLCGDLNLYSASEAAFQNLLLFSGEDYRFYDPVNKIGEWHANSFFAGVHTQSTHTEGGCHSGGGMDDRFDFFLVSEEILDGTEKVKYIPASCIALGQDGMRFDQSLISPANYSVPAEVLTALYAMSDHLPLILGLATGGQPGTIRENQGIVHLVFNNPAKETIRVKIYGERRMDAEIQLIDLFGRVLRSQELISENENTIHFQTDDLPGGTYFILFKRGEESPILHKLILLK